MRTPGLLAALDGCERVLIAGAGGGFDVYAGLPLALHLMIEERTAYLATAGLPDYFPERILAAWLHTQNLPSTVYAFPLVGVQPLRAAYRVLVERLGIDAIVLVDGGTDILLRDRIENTVGIQQVLSRITAYRAEVTARTPRVFPH